MTLDNDLRLKYLRFDRNDLLKETDAWMATDRGLTQEQTNELLAYRQALRDMPSTVNPQNIVWPEMPVWMV